MIGVYDYTVILTYLSLLSAGAGIAVSLGGLGHPYYGIFFLLFCGLCDAFDGRVAHTKKNRTEKEKKFGIQIDSLSDLVAFGVLPACIGMAFVRRSVIFERIAHHNFSDDVDTKTIVLTILLFGVLILYILAALIRLAYFNVDEEERQQTEGGRRTVYLGLPVTTAAIIFPTIALFTFVIPKDITWVYILGIIITGILFITPFKLPKMNFKGVLWLIALGVIEFAILLLTTIL